MRLNINPAVFREGLLTFSPPKYVVENLHVLQEKKLDRKLKQQERIIQDSLVLRESPPLPNVTKCGSCLTEMAFGENCTSELLFRR